GGPTAQTSSPGRPSNVRSATASTGSPRPAYTLRRWRTSRLAPPGWSTTSWSGATSAGLVMSGTSVLGLPVPEVPAQDRVRHDAEDEGQQHAHDAEQEDPAPHLRDREAALELDDREAQTVLGREHRADDQEDDPDRQGLPSARDDLRARAAQHEVAQRGHAAQPVGAGGVAQHGVEAAHALDRVEQHGPHAPDG